MTKPKEESLFQQKKYLFSKNIDTSYLFNLDDNFADYLTSNYYPLNEKDTNGFLVIQSRIYDKNKNILLNWASCYGDIRQYLYQNCEVHPFHDSTYFGKTNKSLTLNLLSKYVNNPERFNTILHNNSKLYIISFWAKYLGTPSYNSLKKIDDIVDSSECKISHIKINIGYVK